VILLWRQLRIQTYFYVFVTKICLSAAVWGTPLGRGVPQKRQPLQRSPNGLSGARAGHRLKDAAGMLLHQLAISNQYTIFLLSWKREDKSVHVYANIQLQHGIQDTLGEC
jgi:hypothetical protein